MNNIRLKIAKEKLYMRNSEGLIIIDDLVTHKTGKKMEKANYHRSGTTKQKEWGHNLVDSLYLDLNSYKHFPIHITSYLRKIDCDMQNPFKTKRDIALEIVDVGLKQGIDGIVCADAWYYSEDFVKELKHRGLKYIIGIKANMKISINRNKRISIAEYLKGLNMKKDFSKYNLQNGTYFIHNVLMSIRGEGKSMLLISYKKGDEKEIKCYTTNILNWSKEKYMNTLVKRWSIECLHRDNKQHLGLEEYRVRKYRGMQIVALAILTAYTLLVLNSSFSLLNNFRPLKTIGEMCRFAKLAAQKSKYWLEKTFTDLKRGAQVLNQLVLVKNAKV